MSSPARTVLVLGLLTVLVVVLGVRRGSGQGGFVVAEGRGRGLVEGRIALDGELVALFARGDVPAPEVRARLPWGYAATRIDENGSFLLMGLPSEALDLEVRLGGEVLARVPDVVPTIGARQRRDLSPRLDGVRLAGPLHVIELTVEAQRGGPVDEGWLAWRHAGESTFEAVTPIVDGCATIVSLSELVDVEPLVPGLAAQRSPCRFDGDRLLVPPGRRIHVDAPDVPAGIVLRLELVRATPAADFTGEALARSIEARGGWVQDGVAELALPASGEIAVRWGLFVAYGERLTRLRECDAPVVDCHVPEFAFLRVDVPLPRVALSERFERQLAQEGLLQR